MTVLYLCRMKPKQVWVVHNGEESKPHGYIKGKEYTIKVYTNAGGDIIVMPRTDIENKITYYTLLVDFLKDWLEINYFMDA